MIPARQGSKRIPGKNIKDFLGKPIITYPIETAKESGIFDDIVVYTDDNSLQDIAKIKDIRVTVWANRPWVSDNETLTETALGFIINYKETFKQDIDYLCILLPTGVFVYGYMLGESLHELTDHSYNCIISLCKYNHPIQRAFRINEFNELEMIQPEYIFNRTQDCEKNYYDAGQFYFFNVKSFLNNKKIFMNNSHPYILDAVDIDNPEDWKKAEMFYKVQMGLI